MLQPMTLHQGSLYRSQLRVLALDNPAGLVQAGTKLPVFPATFIGNNLRQHGLEQSAEQLPQLAHALGGETWLSICCKAALRVWFLFLRKKRPKA